MELGLKLGNGLGLRNRKFNEFRELGKKKLREKKNKEIEEINGNGLRNGENEEIEFGGWGKGKRDEGIEGGRIKEKGIEGERIEMILKRIDNGKKDKIIKDWKRIEELKI